MDNRLKSFYSKISPPQLTWIVLVAALLGLFFQNTQLEINRTQSLPQKVFLSVKGLPFKRGDLVSIVGHTIKGVGSLPLIKQVAGMPGDKVAPLLGALKTQTRSGMALTPLNLEVIPEGFVFVRTDHPDSFDSRYAEFGLVKVAHIYGRALPLW